MINGTNTLVGNKAAVTSISRQGIILSVNGHEYYLPYDKYPWFKRAAVDDVFNVKLLGKEHIRWEALDIDLSLSILLHPENYPLISK